MIGETKIIFIDLDGTLLNKKSEITFYTQNIIKEVIQKGIFFVICSGRANRDTVNIIKEMNTKIVISDNGSIVYDYIADKKIFESDIKKNILTDIWKFARKNNVSLTCNGTYNRFKDKDSNKEAIIVKEIDEVKEDITQIVATAKEYASIEKVKHYIKDNYPEIEVKNLWCQNSKETKKVVYEMDITNKNNSKGNAIKNLLKYLSIDKKYAICFGDQMNDVSMFKACDIKIAMKNANDELKAKADYITDYDNDNDGVAKFISKNLL